MYSIKMRSSNQNLHISGAETICELENIEQTIQKFYNKGFFHENGQPDFLNIKIQKIMEPIKQIKALSIIENDKSNLQNLILECGISEYALKQGMAYIEDGIVYTGAIIISATSGERLDSAGDRGIRVTNFSFEDINNKADLSERVKDALAIASCINSKPYVKGELCVSDDLTYTTGYFATGVLGYHRLFNIKKANTRHGGRIIFVDDDLDLNSYISFLESTPKQINYK
ncbi:TPA: 6-carboxyhexanoate--CoA ligase [Staphylococcus argenteus]|uniref:6-carboxyhexanoate--CoA ligase n=1 Tax=Staphylococcus argenteus TaxID=985002 RepID=UPI00050862DB|nr:6-carboxyhexanoate--CoA ligase [Staphylococcus argenteus]MBE2136365.1 6-carboxyhexanoate--CoA ligase [Staphylococcus argenteus]MDT3005605.1 6-carboxyhexanoate--CoA ligase [Staphylococcus argenteus]UPO20605.1 6-carboxyhexanoate--CoA ligase [Staphylococcus argenteus]CDR64117.1 6-carboxyhexanoate--CoA ligase [Staphylococcus argenteus]HDY9446968.1 6-carboxyhexanoate--CoA ligase [Staphylococcus argenteus]